MFTHDLHTAFLAFQRLQVGGVVVRDVPSYRTQDRVLVLTDVTL